MWPSNDAASFSKAAAFAQRLSAGMWFMVKVVRTLNRYGNQAVRVASPFVLEERFGSPGTKFKIFKNATLTKGDEQMSTTTRSPPKEPAADDLHLAVGRLIATMSTSSPVPTSTQLHFLPFKCVLLTAIDEDNKRIPGATSTGFILAEADGEYLYTCWHVVTGYDPNDLKVKVPPRRRYLNVSMQATIDIDKGVKTIGGFRTFTLPLYDRGPKPGRPIWFQDDSHIPHPDLNAIGIYVPFSHDVVKIRMPPGFACTEIQLIAQRDIVSAANVNQFGEKVLIVGFPYGYSALGPLQPTPIALTRFIAAPQVAGRRRELLLESPGAPGMSGAPVFKEVQGSTLLFGMYTGLIYPDTAPEREERERTTALGTVADMSLLLTGAMELTQRPSTALTSEGGRYNEA